ncbi:MAG: iron-containing alcohol dehydrogenase [Prevotella sp.]|jgi:hypothetical protein
MKDFTYYAPTEVVFGENAEEKTAKMVKKYGGTKVLLHYGGNNAIRSGLLRKIRELLDAEGIPYVMLGGVVPNPRLELAQKGIDICRKEGIDFILAVGGGSVIDSAKCIAYGACYDGDVWDFYLGYSKAVKTLPVGTVVTIPAAGSEMSEASVITNDRGALKLGYSNNISRPKFAIMNPRRTFTLHPYQTAAGVTDMMMHTMERYFTKDDDMDLTTDLAEAVLRRMKTAVYAVLKNPEDYRQRAQIMWGGSVAHWGITGCGVSEDWATHQLEHELSAKFGVTHGAGLAAIWPSWARYVMHENLSRFVRFAVNVMDVNNDFSDPEGTALRGIEAMEKFYKDIGMPTTIKELVGREITEGELQDMVRKCSRGYSSTCGCLKVLQAKDMEAIYRMALK